MSAGESSAGSVLGMHATARETARHGGGAPGGDRFLVRQPGLAQVHVHVDEARSDHGIAGVERLGVAGAQMLADFGDAPVTDEEIAPGIQGLRRIDDAAAEDQERRHPGFLCARDRSAPSAPPRCARSRPKSRMGRNATGAAFRSRSARNAFLEELLSVGFFADKLLGELRAEFIARPDASKDQIVYKWPNQTIRKLSQLTVEADETAVFFRDGKVAGTFPPGRYTLDSSQIPFLGILVDAATGGNLFKTEVYFVGTREFTNLPFGGTVDNVLDPETSLAVGLRVFGDYALKVVDAGALIVNLVGSQNLTNNDEISGWMREMVLKSLRQEVVTQIVAGKWAILGIATHTAEIEQATLASVQQNVAPYGVAIARMGNFTVSLGDDDAATLKNYRRDVSYTKLAGSFTQYGAGEALRGIGEGAAKGDGAGNAALLGLGVGLSNVFAGAANAPPASAAASAAPAQPQAPGATCPQCGTPAAAGAKFCGSCGAALAPAPLHCSACGTETPAGAKFCAACGTKL